MPGQEEHKVRVGFKTTGQCPRNKALLISVQVNEHFYTEEAKIMGQTFSLLNTIVFTEFTVLEFKLVTVSVILSSIFYAMVLFSIDQ